MEQTLVVCLPLVVSLGCFPWLFPLVMFPWLCSLGYVPLVMFPWLCSLGYLPLIYYIILMPKSVISNTCDLRRILSIAGLLNLLSYCHPPPPSLPDIMARAPIPPSPHHHSLKLTSTNLYSWKHTCCLPCAQIHTENQEFEIII